MTRCLLLATLTACSPAAASQAVHVHDGDTMTIDGQRWRLWGIDAPEIGQMCERSACGDQARVNLQRLVSGKEVWCQPVGKSYDRTVGKCFAGTLDLSGSQVRSGWALDYLTYSKGAYAVFEAQAREERVGIWAGEFQAPWEWRKAHRKSRWTRLQHTRFLLGYRHGRRTRHPSV